MKSIAGYTLMAFGAYYILMDLGGIGAILNLIKSSKENLPKYSQQIAQIENKIQPQLEQFQGKPSPNPSPFPTMLPAQEKEKELGIGLEWKLRTPWLKLESKADAK